MRHFSGQAKKEFAVSRHFRQAVADKIQILETQAPAVKPTKKPKRPRPVPNRSLHDLLRMLGSSVGLRSTSILVTNDSNRTGVFIGQEKRSSLMPIRTSYSGFIASFRWTLQATSNPYAASSRKTHLCLGS